jgi:TATA-box binding protein (TBP) (component of TFIID and TFIIIB)
MLLINVLIFYSCKTLCTGYWRNNDVIDTRAGVRLHFDWEIQKGKKNLSFRDRKVSATGCKNKTER